MKYIGAIITILAGLLTFIFGYGMLTAKQKGTEKEVTEVKLEVEELEDRTVDLEKYDIQQSIILERVTNVLDKMEK